jgi:hypothetical protein
MPEMEALTVIIPSAAEVCSALNFAVQFVSATAMQERQSAKIQIVASKHTIRLNIKYPPIRVNGIKSRYF